MTKYRREFRRIAKRLTLADIQAGDPDEILSLDSLVSDGRVSSSSNFLMGAFSEKGVQKVLDVFGFSKILAGMGLKNIQIHVDTSDPHTHRLYAYYEKKCSENKICELVLKRGPLHFAQIAQQVHLADDPDLLQIEWLLLQNPKDHFSIERPQLPGQKYPGLNLGDRLMELLIIMTRRLGLCGMVAKPNYFHTAHFFEPEFGFVNPQHQAIMSCYHRDLLDHYPFYTVAWAAHFDCVINTKEKKVLDWEPGYLVMPLTRNLMRYFRSKNYQNTVQQKMKDFQLSIQMDRFVECMRQNQLKLADEI